MISKQLTEKNTKTSRLAESNPTVSCLAANRESRKFISLNCRKRFRNAFIMMPLRATHIPPSKLPIKRLFTSSDRNQNDNGWRNEKSIGANMQPRHRNNSNPSNSQLRNPQKDHLPVWMELHLIDRPLASPPDQYHRSFWRRSIQEVRSTRTNCIRGEGSA